MDASGAGVRFESGAASDLANGVRVEIEGTSLGGILQATKVEFRGHGSHSEGEVELHGAIESIDGARGVLSLRGQTVIVDAQTVFHEGSMAQLAVGTTIEVKGTLTSDGQAIHADEIHLEH